MQSLVNNIVILTRRAYAHIRPRRAERAGTGSVHPIPLPHRTTCPGTAAASTDFAGSLGNVGREGDAVGLLGPVIRRGLRLGSPQRRRSRHGLLK